MSELSRFRWAGICGVLAALAWTVGDALLVGNFASAQSYPALLEQHAGDIDTAIASLTVGSSMTRLAAGALVGALTIPLYLIACWHLYTAAKPAGRWFALPATVLLFLGHAYAPLGHAGFYYVAAVYKTILTTPETAHAQLFALAQDFHTVLLIMYAVAVSSLVLGLLWLIAAMASGRSAWPRWMAIAVVAAVAFAILLGHLPIPQPLRAWLDGAGINVSWLLIFLLSVVVLWNRTQLRPSSTEEAVARS